MKSHLTIHNIDHHTDEWFEFRKRGIGGSEIGTVLGINKYDTAIRLFHEKIGNTEPRRDDNERMFWGRYMEDKIADIWQYYDGTKTGYLENFTNKKVIRKCRKINGYVTNSKYPWLFASVDRLINKETGINLITGEPLEEEGILEIKNMGMWMSKVWEDGIPIYHLAQIHVYMAILETDYAEIALLVDGNDLVVEKLQRDDGLVQRILNISESFWYSLVLPAKMAREKRDVADVNGNLKEAQKQEGIIQRLEPEPDESEAYKDYMQENFLRQREVIEGTQEMLNYAKMDKSLGAFEKVVKGQRSKLKNMFIKFMGDNGSDTVDFGSMGTVSWGQSKNRGTRTFRNNIKLKIDDDLARAEFDKINKKLY